MVDKSVKATPYQSHGKVLHQSVTHLNMSWPLTLIACGAYWVLLNRPLLEKCNTPGFLLGYLRYISYYFTLLYPHFWTYKFG